MSKNETIHLHVRRIGELYDSISELARCEHKRIEDYTASELVATAENILDIMADWFENPDIGGDRRSLAVERRKLQNFIKKWGPTA
jgi:hypothetical protein